MTCTHKALTPTEPVAKALGESDKIMYGQGSVAKTAAGIDPKSGDMGGSFSDAIMNQAYMTNPITGIPNAIGGGVLGALGPAGSQSARGSALSIIPGVPGFSMMVNR